MSLVHKIQFQYSDKFTILKKVYNNIITKSNDDILKDGFNNFKGDITKDIVWTWVINNISYKLFQDFFEEINLINNLNSLFDNEFKILGISFITLNKKEILENDTSFHFDILSPYDLKDKTNILTVLLPLEFTKEMGGLEYIENDEIHKYQYKFNEYIVFDSSKVEHRTMPFKYNGEKTRVLISVNLSSDIEWAMNATKDNTKHQGNLFTI